MNARINAARDPYAGLTREEVEERIRKGQVNFAPESSSRSIGAILRENILTLFNAILGSLLVLILAVGDIRDALFGLVLFGNMFIGIVQELRAKVTLDRLSVLSAPRARVVRDAREEEIGVEEVVLGDLVRLSRGDQVVADGEVLLAQGLQIDESLLTGESEPVDKEAGENLLSGSFVVAGSGSYRATAVGREAYAHRLTEEARRYKLVHSELRAGINRILAGMTWIMIPTGILVFWRQLSIERFRTAISGSVAAMVGMIPEGLVLLTSVAFALAIVVLGRRKVLVQELPAVEGLARVDIVCFDKTGTITESRLEFEGLELLNARRGDAGAGAGKVEPVRMGDFPEIAAALAALAEDPASRNPTIDAIAAAFEGGGAAGPQAGAEPSARVPFSSERKWSAVVLGGNTWILGAPELLLEAAEPGNAETAARVRAQAGRGKRVLLLARHAGEVRGESLPGRLEPAALVLLMEKIRGDAAETLAYFDRQGVGVKIISGDNPRTVAAVAGAVGVDVKEPVDGRSLPDEPAMLSRIMDDNTVFGRVTAQQKQAMLKALKDKGHVVAMTGDGVNDTLAVKEADIGIALGAGASAPTKAVAELVLLDGRFSGLPGVVAEGRRVIANIERVAYLFVTKTSYATILAITIALLGWPFPFLPRHLTLVGAITIGIPAFFLALAPSSERYVPGFVGRVLKFTIPAGAVLAAGTIISYALSRRAGASLEQSRTMSTLVLTVMGLFVLILLAQPLTFWRRVLIGAMIGGLVVAMVTPLVRQFLAFEFPHADVLLEALAVAGLCVTILGAGIRITGWHPRGPS